MNIDPRSATIIGLLLIGLFCLMTFWEKALSIRKLSQRQPPLEDEFRALLAQMETRIMAGVRNMIPNVSDLKIEFMRELQAKQLEIERAENRSREAIAELRSRHEKAIPEIFDQIRQANATFSQCYNDITAMVARVEGAFQNHVQSDKGKG